MSPAPDALPSRLQRLARQHGARPALQWRHLGRWRVLDWSALHEHAQALAAGLHALGLGPGRELALVGEPGPALVLALLALRRLSATLVVAESARQPELVGQASHVLAVGDHDLEQVLRDLGSTTCVVIAGDPPAGAGPATGGRAGARLLSLSLAQVLQLESARPAAAAPAGVPAVRILCSDGDVELHEPVATGAAVGGRVFAEGGAAWPPVWTWLLGGWLQGGATLVLPEPGGDARLDRAQARAPTWLAPAGTVGALLAGLPGRVRDAALARAAVGHALGAGSGPLARLLRGRLRAGLGLAATTQLLSDLAPRADTLATLRGLGLAWQPVGRAAATPPPRPAVAPEAALLAVGDAR